MNSAGPAPVAARTYGSTFAFHGAGDAAFDADAPRPGHGRQGRRQHNTQAS